MTLLFSNVDFPRQLHCLLQAGQKQATRLGSAVLISATTQIPPIDFTLPFAQAKGQQRIWWEQPRRDLAMVGVGAAAQAMGHGPQRFSQLSSAWRSLVSHAVTDAPSSYPLSSPISMGGFAFDPANHSPSPWGEYPDALLTIPQFFFLACQGSTWLTVNLGITPACNIAATVDAALCGSQALLSVENCSPEKTQTSSVELCEHGTQEAAWKASINAAVQAIGKGEIEKLVLAREVRAHAAHPIDPCSVMRKLRAQYQLCSLFAFGHEQSCFVGATPERLVRLNGERVWVDCLAGTTRRGATEEEDRLLGMRLLADDKERHEHEIVARNLLKMLTPVCSHVSAPETPTLLRMPNVQHLHTPIEGVLKQEQNILSFVEKLHPTPACGGFPRKQALPLIRAYEPFNRGWYAAPVGWLDAKGGGEFVVAIRSALLKGREAFLYAGCGIVAGSHAEREYAESCLKLRPMLWAINDTLQ